MAPRGGGLAGWKRLDLLEEPNDGGDGRIFCSVSGV
jgi:hypothetical protein